MQMNCKLVRLFHYLYDYEKRFIWIILYAAALLPLVLAGSLYIKTSSDFTSSVNNLFKLTTLSSEKAANSLTDKDPCSHKN